RAGRGSALPSFVLGIATGLLWAPCAGPILGLILTGAALQGANTGTTVLVAVAAIGFGADTGFLTRISTASTAALEQSLLDKLKPEKTADAMHPANSSMMMAAATDASKLDLPDEGSFPDLSGAVTWLNSPPLTPEALK